MNGCVGESYTTMDRKTNPISNTTVMVQTLIGVNNGSCFTENDTDLKPGEMDPATIVYVFFYGIICIVGLIGNVMVIYVIFRYTKLKTVTNLYILNLSIADTLFLMGLPMTIVTSLLRNWVFGYAMCKIYYITTCINMFTGALTLTALSGDRFLAVVYPITSIRYRTGRHAQIVICLIWLVSFLFMLPVVLYGKSVQNPTVATQHSCYISWPDGLIEPAKAFIVYNLILGFALPVMIISLLYILLVVKLRNTGPAIKSLEKKRSQRRITKLVMMIILIFVICWLPYWSFQVHLILPSTTSVSTWEIYMYHTFTILSYANSAVNPFLYAFTNDIFRESFLYAFKCIQDPILRGFGRRISEYSNTCAVMDKSHFTLALNEAYHKPLKVETASDVDCTEINSSQ